MWLKFITKSEDMINLDSVGQIRAEGRTMIILFNTEQAWQFNRVYQSEAQAKFMVKEIEKELREGHAVWSEQISADKWTYMFGENAADQSGLKWDD